MKKECNISLNCENLDSQQGLQDVQLSATTIQEMWFLFKEFQKIQIIGHTVGWLECIVSSEYISSEGDILVNFDDIKGQFNSSNNIQISCCISNGYEQSTLGCNNESTKSGSRNLVLEQMETELALYKKQSDRNSRYSLFTLPLRELFKRKIEKISKDPDKQQLNYLIYPSGFISIIICEAGEFNQRNCRNSQSPTSRIPYSLSYKQDTGFIVEIISFWILFTTSLSLRECSTNIKDTSINRFIFELEELKIEAICQPDIKQLGSRIIFSIASVEGRTDQLLSANRIDPSNSQQSETEECSIIYNCAKLAIQILIAQIDGSSNEQHQSGKK
ncbi:MAG: hypothetical protein EZS28_004113 [Streblomastix strix]|uniref:Uncharacterized protein n=1 Tax=Streblomastix strix TaxID=222440 RepID=A0A5J4X0S2_9EUKA|nr:MAG: hypothetical protein EZS28_004113 [Streblomastix strix]